MEITRDGMSQRGFANVESIMPKIKNQVAERKKTNNHKIDLGTSENILIRPELQRIYKKAINDALTSNHLSYPKGFSGDPSLLIELAKFFNMYFDPVIPVEPDHLVTAPGAATCLDTLLFNICDPGDAVLVPGPYWNGFDFQFRVRCSVEPVVVNVDKFSGVFTMQLLPALSAALKSSKHPVRALVMTNPHNPFGQCYPKDVLEECVKFCQQHKIHYISDEVYALSAFPSVHANGMAPFVSALNFNLDTLGCDPKYVHTVWSISKDFGSSGIRMGCIVTQANSALAVGTALAANTQTSSLSAIAVTRLLSSSDLPSLIRLNSVRLAAAYDTVTEFFTRHGIEYIPVTAGLFVFAHLNPRAETWDDEATTIAELQEAGVIVSAGRAYHVIEHEKGWARITFAVDPDDLRRGLDLISRTLNLD